MVGSTFIIMVSLVAEQPPNCGVIVHTKVLLAPTVNPVTPLVGEDGVVTAAVPAITDQAPLSPTPAELPAKVAVVILHKF